MASMRDVARLAGVSESTVSRVINRTIRVEDQTRDRVERAIQKLSYKPNLLAKGLRIKSGHLIGLAVPEIVSYVFACFIQYTEESAVKRGYRLIVGNDHGDPDTEAGFIDNLVRRNVDGIIFSRVSDDSRILRLINRLEVPVVIIDRAFADESIPSVVLDNYRAGYLAGAHLAGLGHTRMACITGPLKITLCRERLEGFTAALAEKGCRLEEGAVFEGDTYFESGYEAAKSFISGGRRVTAIWAQSDLMAVGALKYMQENGVGVPGDVSLVGMDDISLARMITPSLTTIRQPFREICEKAVDLLMRQKDGTMVTVEKQVISPSLVVRDSTRAIR